MKSQGSAIIPAALTCLAVGVSLTGCATTSSPDSMTFLLSNDPGSLNPAKNYSQGAEEIIPFFYETLLALRDNGDVEGWLAEQWTGTSSEATFTLKDDVTCADGTPLTVDDVEGTFEYMSDPEVAAAYFGTRIPAEGVDITTDPEAGTVSFVTKGSPDSFFVQNIGSVPIICGTGLEAPESLEDSLHGTGPYTIASSVSGQTYDLVLRDDYTWGPKPVDAVSDVMPANIRAEVVASDATRANMLVSGQANVALIGGSDRARVEESSPQTQIDLDLGFGTLIFNEAAGRPGSDVAVRQALAHALDRDAIGQVASENRGEPINNMVPGSLFCGDTDSSAAIPAFDSEKAGALLDEAGWVVGSDGIRTKDGTRLKMTILYNPVEGAAIDAAMELAQSELAAIGVDATISASTQWIDVLISAGDWDLVWFPVAALLPSVWYNQFTAPEGTNLFGTDNAEYERIGAEANLIGGVDSCELWADAQAALFADADVFPTWTYTRSLYGTNVSFDTQQRILIPSTLRIGD